MPLAGTPVIQVAGLALCYVGSGAAGVLEHLAYSRDGVVARFDGYFLDVPCDDNGGEAGPPADIQYMGETALITIEATKIDESIALKIRQRRNTGTFTAPGVPGAAGLLMLSGGLGYRLVVGSTTLALDFPACVFREPFEVNKGTKFSTWRIEATAYKHPSTGILWTQYAALASVPGTSEA